MGGDDSAADGLRAGLATTIAQERDGAAEESGDVPLMVDRFVIEDELGAGGMGRVYVAYDPTLDRRVAVKLLRDRLGVDADSAHARMAREARAMARLRHPNVVTVHEVGAHDGGVFIVMEYVGGGTLRDWLERTPEADWRQIVAMYVLAGRGLAAAHGAGLVHRDFKPDNVLVGDDGRVLVGDFGIANMFGDEPSQEPPSGDPLARLARAGSVIGTPPYMSPEQHLGNPVDARTDQFALCAALYEALYGTRPFAGERHAEIAERAIRGEITPPARDRGAPSRIRVAILRGLRPAPADRFPSMAALLGELATDRRSPARRIVIAAGVALVAVPAIWLVMHDSSTAPATPRSAIGLIAVESFDVALPSYTLRPELREGVGDVIALLLADVDGFKAVGPTHLLGADGVREAAEKGTAPPFLAAEAKAGAAYIIRGSIDERRDRVHARIEALRPDGTRIATVERERPTTEFPMLLDDAAEAIAGTIAPGKALDRSHTSNRARALHAIGEEHLRNNDYQMAWTFLEQAVIADPTFFEGWYSLALTRSWLLAPENRVFEALEAARATAPTELKRRLVEGEGRYLHHDFAGARAILEPLVTDPALSQQELRDTLYFLGEAHWHDGHHRVGTGYLQRALDVDLKFKLPVQHLGEYVTANRDLGMMAQYSPMVASSTRDFRGRREFALGHYEEVARTGAFPLQLQAALLLGRTPTAELEAEFGNGLDGHVYRAARALADGNPAAARIEIDRIWKQVLARKQVGELADNTYYSLEMIGDVILCAGLVDEARRLVAFLAVQSRDHPVRGYQRLSILSATLVHDRTWIIRRDLTDRNRQLADAIEAEMAGDRARAVKLLDQLVKDPSPSWDYPERVALLRNLRALHRTNEARALCEDTLRPAVFHWAFLPTRRLCNQR